MQIADIYEGHQWPRDSFMRAVHGAARAEIVRAAEQGDLLSLEAAIDRTTAHWLDAAMPAGNA